MRTQERNARIADAANEAEQALYNVLRISPPQPTKPTLPLTPRRQTPRGRVFMAWLERKGLAHLRGQLSLLVSTPGQNHAHTREAKRQASIWATRYASHAVVLLLLFFIAIFGGFKGLTVQAAASAPASTAASIDEGNFGMDIGGYSSLDGDAAVKADIAARAQIITQYPNRVKGYVAQAGDTVASVAAKFGIDKATLLWANHIADPDANLTPGDNLIILPVNGMYHKVIEGDTVESIAAEYQVEPSAIINYKPNQLQPPYLLSVGAPIIVPGGHIPPRSELLNYTPHPGETVDGVAQKFGLDPSTIILVNPGLDRSVTLDSSSQIIVPPTDGLLHNVVEGDTIVSVAQYYGVNPQVLVDFAPNHLKAGDSLSPGLVVMVPGGLIPTPTPTATPEPTSTPTPQPTLAAKTKAKATPAPSRAQPIARTSRSNTGGSSGSSDTGTAIATKLGGSSGAGSGHFIWPTHGIITQGFWAWEWGHRHNGLDIANDQGTDIVAADGGTVVWAGWRTDGLGYCVIIDHHNGYQTIYGHMRHQPSVWEGEDVRKGQYLGPMGTTGHSTGPHLHFMIKYDGVPRDPINYLP